jgi:hypothetical protein
MLMIARFDPSLDNEIRTFSRNLLKKTSETASSRSQDGGVGQYGNYASQCSQFFKATVNNADMYSCRRRSQRNFRSECTKAGRAEAHVRPR